MTCPTGPGSSPSFPTKVDLAKALRCYQLPFDVWSHEIHALFIQAFSPDRKDLGIPSYSMARFFQIRVQIILYNMDQNEAFLHPAHILSISFLIGTNDIPRFFLHDTISSSKNQATLWPRLNGDTFIEIKEIIIVHGEGIPPRKGVLWLPVPLKNGRDSKENVDCFGSSFVMGLS